MMMREIEPSSIKRHPVKTPLLRADTEWDGTGWGPMQPQPLAVTTKSDGRVVVGCRTMPYAWEVLGTLGMGTLAGFGIPGALFIVFKQYPLPIPVTYLDWGWCVLGVLVMNAMCLGFLFLLCAGARNKTPEVTARVLERVIEHSHHGWRCQLEAGAQVAVMQSEYGAPAVENPKQTETYRMTQVCLAPDGGPQRRLLLWMEQNPQPNRIARAKKFAREVGLPCVDYRRSDEGIQIA